MSHPSTLSLATNSKRHLERLSPIQPWLLNKTGSEDLVIRNTMYFILPFNKNQRVKLEFPDQNLEDYDVIPRALIPEEGALWIWVY